MMSWLIGAASGVGWKPAALAVAAVACAAIGWQCRAVIAQRDVQAIRLEWSAERAQLANVAIRERDNALSQTRRMADMAAAADTQAANDRATITKLIGSLINANPLPADCRLDSERVRLLQAAP